MDYVMGTRHVMSLFAEKVGALKAYFFPVLRLPILDRNDREVPGDIENRGNMPHMMSFSILYYRSSRNVPDCANDETPWRHGFLLCLIQTSNAYCTVMLRWYRAFCISTGLCVCLIAPPTAFESSSVPTVKYCRHTRLNLWTAKLFLPGVFFCLGPADHLRKWACFVVTVFLRGIARMAPPRIQYAILQKAPDNQCNMQWCMLTRMVEGGRLII
jgi:hypothetical protein